MEALRGWITLIDDDVVKIGSAAAGARQKMNKSKPVSNKQDNVGKIKPTQWILWWFSLNLCNFEFYEKYTFYIPLMYRNLADVRSNFMSTDI